MVRMAGTLLHDSLSRRFELQVSAPDDLFIVAADPLVVEATFYGIIYRAAEASPESGILRIGVEPDKPGAAALEVEVSGTAGDAAERFLRPAREEGDLGLTALLAAVEACGAALGVAAVGDDGLRVRAVFALDE